MGKILVTGPLGNVGRQVVRACESAGLRLRLAGKVSALAAAFPQHEAAEFDFYTPQTWEPALSGCDQLFLMRPPQIADVSATLVPLIDAARRSGVGHVVFSSVARADEMKWVPHRKVELHLRSTGCSHTLLRSGFFAQNLKDAYRRDIIEDHRLYLPSGDARVAFLDVQDVGDVAAQVFLQPERFLNAALALTGPQAVTFREVAALLQRVLGVPIRYVPTTVAAYAWHLRTRRGLDWSQIAVQSYLHVGLRRGDAEEVTSAVRDVLGRPPRSIAEFIELELPRFLS